MVAISLHKGLSSPQIGKDCDHHGDVTEQIAGLIKVYSDGYVERPLIVPYVASRLDLEHGVSSTDIVIDKLTNLWSRFYVPTSCCHGISKIPLVVYFHGGGFCVGSAAWSCYHEFLERLAAKTGCLIMSINYRLAPENPLPAAYEDGIKALIWLKQIALLNAGSDDQFWWSNICDFSNIFVAGDSAGANIAYNTIRMASSDNQDATIPKPLKLTGMIMIQPFFGAEERTDSEKNLKQSAKSALSLEASDTYWRLALPGGSNRDHPWCNPLVKGPWKLMDKLMVELPIMVCISEMDILKDRNLKFVAALRRCSKKVVQVVHKGVGHAFQVLSQSQISQARTIEMMSQIRGFISG